MDAERQVWLGGLGRGLMHGAARAAAPATGEAALQQKHAKASTRRTRTSNPFDGVPDDPYFYINLNCPGTPPHLCRDDHRVKQLVHPQLPRYEISRNPHLDFLPNPPTAPLPR